MRPFGQTLPFDEALRIVMDGAVEIERIETVALGEADGRIAAADVAATIDVPSFDRAAMDGYAVIAGDTASASPTRPATLLSVDRVFTGDMPRRVLRAGECMEIATGAPLPAGADAVVMVEATSREGDRVLLHSPLRAQQNVGRRGQDLVAGQAVVRAGQLIGPSRVGALAATGVTAVSVYARPSVALLSTGNEIVDPGKPLEPGQIYDINRFTLQSVVNRHGGVAWSLPIAGDSIEALTAALDIAASHDVIVCSGGSSVGDRDLVIDALRSRGEVHFHGIAVKPGKPTAFAHIGTTPVFALPGNPTSCLSNAYLLVAPFLRRLARLPAWDPRTVSLPLSRRLESAANRHQFYSVRITNGQAEPAFKGSGAITSMAMADGYMEIPVSTDTIEAGTLVRVTLFG
jgi:molybdopterin molybdotransferase